MNVDPSPKFFCKISLTILEQCNHRSEQPENYNSYKTNTFMVLGIAIFNSSSII